MSDVMVEVEVRIKQASRGATAVLIGGAQGDSPGIGQAGGFGPIGNAQMMFKNASEVVPGNTGSLTLANILTALQTVASDLAGASGTPKISTADLAVINAWATGSP